MPWIRTPEAPHGPRQCRTLRFRLPLREIESATSNTFDFGANHSIHLHSGLPFPCLRFAVSVATPHARLGTWLLARLCHGSHLRLLNFVRFQGATPPEPAGPRQIAHGPAGFNLRAAASNPLVVSRRLETCSAVSFRYGSPSVVMSFASSRRRSMFVASACASSGA